VRQLLPRQRRQRDQGLVRQLMGSHASCAGTAAAVRTRSLGRCKAVCTPLSIARINKALVFLNKAAVPDTVPLCLVVPGRGGKAPSVYLCMLATNVLVIDPGDWSL